MVEDSERVERIIGAARAKCTTTRVDQVVKKPAPPVKTRAPPPPPPPEALRIEEEIVQVLNHVRTDPKEFALRELKPLLNCYDGLIYKPPQLESILVQTVEGIAALEECITFLQKAEPIAPLMLDNGLGHAAQDHVKDIGSSGKTEHAGSDGSSMSDRMDRYGEWQGTCGENIALGTDDARAIVVQLLVDDGIPTRGHRTNIMNDEYRVVGIAVGQHCKFKKVCVMDFAGGFGQRVDRLNHNDSVTVVGELTERVEKILNSVPIDSIKDEVYIALQTRPEQRVTLNYTPSSIEAIFENPDGSSVTQSGSWGVKKVDV